MRLFFFLDSSSRLVVSLRSSSLKGKKEPKEYSKEKQSRLVDLIKSRKASFERISVASARTSGMVDQEFGLKSETNGIPF